MWKDRLKRIVIILVVAVLVFFAGKVFADWRAKKKIAGESISLPTQQIGEKISDFGEKILGKAVEVLPGGDSLKQKIAPTQESSTGENPVATPTNSEEVKVEKVETKTQEIIEIIKELPAEQLENIKKQVFKDFCQKVLEEEDGRD